MGSLIIKRAETKVRQSLFGGFMLVAALLMIANSFGWVFGGDNTNANVSFNITSGTFSLDNGPTQFVFASQVYGTDDNVTANQEVDLLAVTDYRGTGTEWNVAANANNLANGTNIISAYRLSMYATTATATNVEAFDTNRVNLGSTGSLGGTGMTLANGSTQASGIVRFDNAAVRLQITATDAAGNYGAKVLFTLS
ncbi:hypothetical protein A2V68_01625 [candidate division Kazan bacterium RBG_13_50_9]|uniref:Uncharacterized protein n=1 Tax=candidate division Kazan bacterium RBG_13_50_9 TaxID=1798535 RepID=A0A1F4NSN2_UNCK3|nr:MAG: hypothetical protein A2V68_01625 [candidate division Kazan bacterium RBG_13_50_9]